MARQLVKQLEGHERDVITDAAVETARAVERLNQVRADGQLRERHFNALLAIATGEKDTSTMSLEVATGEVYKEVPERKRRRKATGKKPTESPRNTKKGAR